MAARRHECRGERGERQMQMQIKKEGREYQRRMKEMEQEERKTKEREEREKKERVKEFLPGQVVQVLDNLDYVKMMHEERVGWIENMTRVIGKKGQVESIDKDGDVQVSFGEDTYTFISDCLVPSQGKTDIISY